MFTGIVEEIGKVISLKKSSHAIRVEVQAENSLNLGESISVNGCCLTVSELTPHSFFADIVKETLDKTTLLDLKENDLVNLERAMSVGGRFGGHIVQGHVDGVGRIQSKDEANVVTINAPPSILYYVVQKGSITVDGVSLTVKEVDSTGFSFAMIPYTANVTILGRKEVGSRVNLEVDILAKYLEKWIDRTSA